MSGFGVAGLVERSSLRPSFVWQGPSWTGSAILVDRFIEPVVEIDESVSRPKPLLQFFAGHHFSGMLDQRGQYLKWLLLDFYFQSVLSEFARAQINLKHAKAAMPARLSAFSHEEENLVAGECITRLMERKVRGEDPPSCLPPMSYLGT